MYARLVAPIWLRMALLSSPFRSNVLPNTRTSRRRILLRSRQYRLNGVFSGVS